MIIIVTPAPEADCASLDFHLPIISFLIIKIYKFIGFYEQTKNIIYQQNTLDKQYANNKEKSQTRRSNSKSK